MQRLLAGATAVSAPPLALEVYLEHYKGSFGDKWMWAPIVLTPLLTAAGVAGVASERAARTALPGAAALFDACGLLGAVLHARGVARKPGGLREPLYNLVMGPPLLAPGSLALVGALGCSPRSSRASADGGSRRGTSASAEHLPQTCASDAQPATPEELPRQRRGVTPQLHGRYPDYDVLDEPTHWDEVTRGWCSRRVATSPPIRFFNAAESRRSAPSATWCSPRTRSRVSRSSSYIDEKLAEGQLRRLPVRRHARATARPGGCVARGLDEAARRTGRASFATATPTQRRTRVSKRSRTGELSGGVWDELPPSRGVEGRDALRAERLLRAPVGVERDRLRRPRLSAGLLASGRRPARELGGRRGVRARPRRDVEHAGSRAR